MQGFINRRIPLFLRRAITMAPSLVVLAIGVDPSTTLVISQVVLSFGIPFALVPMVLLTRRADIMGALVNRRATTAVASLVAALIIGLNALPALPDVLRIVRAFDPLTRARGEATIRAGWTRARAG